MMDFRLWTRKQEKELLREGKEKTKKIVGEVNKFIAENHIDKFKMGNFNYNGKKLSREEKFLVYYNILATKEENHWKGIITFSHTAQKSELDFVCDTPELREKFINDYLGKGFSILSDIENFRKYLRDVEGRGKNITLMDLQECISNGDLKKSNWTRLNYLLKELYLKPSNVINMEFVYDSLMKGLTIEDVWKYRQIQPYHMFKFHSFNVDYIKAKVA